MPHHKGVSIAVVCEADADRRIICDLVDRVLVGEVDWIEPEVLDAYREWRGLRPGDAYLDIHYVHRLARERNLRVQGNFGGEPGATMAHAARTALVLLATCERPPDAVVILVDSDNDLQRRVGLAQARDARPYGFRAIVIGLAHTKRECWVLAGYMPADAWESAKLQSLREELGFDPTRRPELLTAQQEGAKTDAKRVLRELTRDDVTREPACWRDTPLDLIRQNGAGTGVGEFLDEVVERLVPLFR